MNLVDNDETDSGNQYPRCVLLFLSRENMETKHIKTQSSMGLSAMSLIRQSWRSKGKWCNSKCSEKLASIFLRYETSCDMNDMRRLGRVTP